MRELMDPTRSFRFSPLRDTSTFISSLVLVFLMFSLPLCLAQQITHKDQARSTTLPQDPFKLPPFDESWNLEKDNEPWIWAIEHLIYYNAKSEDAKEDLKEKRKVLQIASRIHGDAIQILRFCCLLNEPNREIRKELMRQWLGQMKYDRTLPPHDVVLEKVRPWIDSTCDEDISHLGDLANRTMPNIAWGHIERGTKNEYRLRCKDLSDTYNSLDNRSNYKRNESEIRTIILFWYSLTLDDLKPFIDKGQPLGSILFSGDREKIMESFGPYLHKHGFDAICVHASSNIFKETLEHYLHIHSRNGTLHP